VALGLLSGILPAQLTTGVLEGTLRAPDGSACGGAPILITGGAGFRTVVRMNAEGAFTASLPYGRYEVFADGGRAAGVTAVVSPLQTTRLDLVMDAAGALRAVEPSLPSTPGLWADTSRGRVYPEAFSLQGIVLSREPASVTQPLDFTGLADNRLGLESQLATSWTATRYTLQGLDATDAYQPGRPAIAPDVQALAEVAVRGGFAQTAARSYGTDVGLFLAEPRESWHGALSTADTASFLASTNLPSVEERGLVRQAEQFISFTRDRVEAGGPLTRWADLFASGAGQWTKQTVPLAPPGSRQSSRLLYGNARSRIRAGVRDQIEVLYSGSRAHLSDWAMPAGFEALAGGRMTPQFPLPGGFSGQPETDGMDFVQAGWTRLLSQGSRLSALQVRYGYSAARFDTTQSAAAGQSRIELLGSAVTGNPPLDNLAGHTRHELAGALSIAAGRHRIAAGGGWETSSPHNRFSAPGGVNLITADGAPAFVMEFNTPTDTRERVRSFSGYVADHVNVGTALSFDAGLLADFSRGAVPAGASPARPDPIAWNSVSPRAGFAWRVPHSHGLVVRGAFFRVYAPLAGRYLDFGNPGSLGASLYRWIDRNSDGWFEAGEQGPLIARFGGPYSSIAASLRRPYSDEFDVGARIAVLRGAFASIRLFRRDEKQRIAAINTGIPAQAFTPVSILDPGPDGIEGTSDDQQFTVYEQNPSTFGQDRFLLTNPPGLRTMNTGLIAELGDEWRRLAFRVSFVAEKSYGPTNPGNAVFENDPGVIGSLFLDPNTAIHAAGRSFMDRAYVAKAQVSYRFPTALGGIEVASVAAYLDGLPFARQLLVTGLAQGPFVVAATVRGSPEGGHRTQYAINWNLRLRREFPLPAGRIAAALDILNVTNAGQRIQERDLSGPSFNQRLPVAIQPPRLARIDIRYEF
jgi:hypothetical protein